MLAENARCQPLLPIPTSSLLEGQPIVIVPSTRATELHLVAALTQTKVASAVIFQWRQKLLCQPQLPLHRGSDSGYSVSLFFREPQAC
jgi:hypothetical protein